MIKLKMMMLSFTFEIFNEILSLIAYFINILNAKLETETELTPFLIR
jgi:hypothetical protein